MIILGSSFIIVYACSEYFILFFILGMYVRYETRMDKLSEDLRMLEMHCGYEEELRLEGERIKKRMKKNKL